MLDTAATETIPELKRFRADSVRRIVDTDAAPHPRMRLAIAENVQMYLHKDILTLLGFDNLITNEFDDLRHPEVPTTHYLLPDRSKHNGVNSRAENYFRNDPTLLFGCSMARATHIFGNKKINSLLEINVANMARAGEVIEYVPQHLAFYPLNRQDFSSAEISINTRNGAPARLVHGPVIVRLTVRDKETTHNQF
jgi:hypothetical protein